MPEWKTRFKEIKIGQGRRLRAGEDIAFLTIGHIGNLAVNACDALAAEGISAAHYDMRFVKPIDELLLHEVFRNFKKVITVEDGCIMGGMGSAVIEFMAQHGYAAQVKMLGIPDAFIEHGEQAELYAECGYDAPGMVEAAMKMVETKGKMSVKS
jgi:1-deoxy-D-xylulose-5-phosphate synthase